MNGERPKFTLRFEHPETHELLRLVAEDLGVSMNSLAEEMLTRELSYAALVMEDGLLDTVELLRKYRTKERLGEDIAAYARAEAEFEDPLEGRMVDSERVPVDRFGVAEAFS